ncbi:MAG: hypothetical protein H7X80_00330, partial [bacterium]|nr:hypothetical protein [Candidatus Kapabacteria bacterium]
MMVFATFAALTTALRAQVRIPSDAAVDREIERLIGTIESDESEADVEIDELLWLREHPIELRTTDAQSLARLPGIDIQLAIAIVRIVQHLQPRDLKTLADRMTLTQRQLIMLRGFTTLDVDEHIDRTRSSARIRVERETVQRRGHSETLRRVVVLADDTRDTIDVGNPYRGSPESILMQF